MQSEGIVADDKHILWTVANYQNLLIIFIQINEQVESSVQSAEVPKAWCCALGQSLISDTATFLDKSWQLNPAANNIYNARVNCAQIKIVINIH